MLFSPVKGEFKIKRKNGNISNKLNDNKTDISKNYAE